MNRLRSDGLERSEQGAVAIIVAASMVMLLVIAAMVLDFGLVRLDRQTNKSSTDAATSAGLQGLNYHNTGKIYSYRGACAALETLRSNEPDLAGLSWSACSDSALLDKVCKASDASTHADLVAAVGSYTVEIHTRTSCPPATSPRRTYRPCRTTWATMTSTVATS